MENLPAYLYIIFILTAIAAVYLFYRASHSRMLAVIIIGWMIFIAAMAWNDFFKVTDTLPPRFLVAVAPPLIIFIILLSKKKSRAWLQSFDLKTLTILQTMRLPVEMVLYWLYLQGLMPELMTFQGRNMDIITGVTAPLIYFVVFHTKNQPNLLLLIWNIAGLVVLIFTVTNGVLSAPSPFQQFAFEQPNVAVLLFPFIWLPAVIVPIAYYSHIISISALIKSYKNNLGSV
ncbi:MAG: hypothetical protein ACK40G_12815 [Cytophagaceae bacterium]